MSKKFAIVVFGLLVLNASQGWTGTSGNGWAQRAAGLPPEEAKTKYVFCYAGNPRVVYLTQVITVAPTESVSNLNAAYGKYIMAAYGLPGFDRQRCVIGNSNADVAAAKKQYLGMFGRTKLIEIEWGGNSAVAQ